MRPRGHGPHGTWAPGRAAARPNTSRAGAVRACASRNVGQSPPAPARPTRLTPTGGPRPPKRGLEGGSRGAKLRRAGGWGAEPPTAALAANVQPPPQQRGPNGRVGAPRRAGGRGGGPRARPPLARVGTPQSRARQRAAVSGAAKPPRGGPMAERGRGEKGGASHGRRGKCFKQAI